MKRTKLSNWGNYPVVDIDFVEEQFYSKVKQIVLQQKEVIARGLGKCYGDASIGELVFSTLKMNRIISFDVERGIICCQSGMVLGDMLQFIVPKGFFLPVTPGTKQITLGGALASDVHGKNHHKNGSFSEYVESFKIINEDGNILDCSKTNNETVFWETCGGMGLTGIVLEVTLKLTPIETSYITLKSIKTKNIHETMDILENQIAYKYSVAWIDCLAKGKSMGRSHISFGEHTLLKDLPHSFRNKPLKVHPIKSKINIPIFFPNWTLNGLTVKLFNSLFFNKQLQREKNAIIHYEPFFYPLDALSNWNRIYGKNGFLQYQFVIPLKNCRTAIPEILEEIVESGQASFLSVLKLMGPANRSVMGFPLEGHTLALDFKISDSLFPLLDKLDKIVHANGGRIYLAKDSRMSKEMFLQMYSKRIVNSDKFVSYQKKRLS